MYDADRNFNKLEQFPNIKSRKKRSESQNFKIQSPNCEFKAEVFQPFFAGKKN